MNGTDVRRRLLRSRTVRATRSGVDLAALWRTLARSTLVDPRLYAAQRAGRGGGSRPSAAIHWLWRGASEGLVLGPLLVPPVVAPRGRATALRRASALRRAGFPRMTSHPLFDIGWYVQQHPEAGTHPGGPLVHWTQLGRAASWPTHPLLASMIDLVELAGAVADPQAPTTPIEPGPGRVEAVVVMPQRWPSSSSLLRTVRPDRPTLVVSADSSALGRLVAVALDRLPGLQVVSAVTDQTLAALMGAGSSEDPVLVAVTPLEITPADLAALAGALEHDDVDMAGPVLLSADGTVVAAGLTAGLAAVAADQSPDDVRRGGGIGPVVALPTDLLVVRRRLLGAVLPLDGAAAGPGAGDAGAIGTVRTPHGVLVAAAAARRLPGLRHPELVADAATAAPPRRMEVSEPAPRLRWAIKSGHPAGSAGQAWGDLHFARALAAALERAGQLAVVDPLEAWYRSSGRYDDVALVLRGLHRFRPQPGQASALWVISHPELVSTAELNEFDTVFAASTSWSHHHSSDNLVVRPLLQCTDPHVFTPGASEPEHQGPPLLFVGNTRMTRRPLVEAAVAADLPLKVVGAGWAGRIDPDAILAEHVANAELPALYASAGIVLNDHWPHMAQQGFLSNRLFDLTAVGAAWVSDPAVGLYDVFPDVARTATDAASLRLLVASAPASMPDAGTRRVASERIRAQHSFDARAKALVDIVIRSVRSPLGTN